MRPSFEFVLERTKTSLICAEIGVRGGHNALDMLNSNAIEKLILVDPYMPYYDDEEFFDQATMDKFRAEMIQRLDRFGKANKIDFQLFTSKVASQMYQDGYFDYVYIDGLHTYEAVKEDSELWYPKIKKNGIIAGHDYIDFKEGLRMAVDEFGKAHNLILMREKLDWMFVCR